MARVKLYENDVWVGETFWGTEKMRRIISIVGGMICYSNGGNKNKFCKVRTMKRWIRSSGATATHSQAIIK